MVKIKTGNSILTDGHLLFSKTGSSYISADEIWTADKLSQKRDVTHS